MNARSFCAVIATAAVVLSAPIAAPQTLPSIEDGPKGRWMDANTGTGSCAVWNSDPEPDEKLEWRGACVGGKAQGRGIVVSTIIKDGREFVTRSEGEMRSGVLSGRVVATTDDGSRLEVDFAQGAPNGQGVFTMGNTRYEGEFKNGQINGKGKIVLDNGDRYEGDFADTKFHGRGTYTAADGTRRSGNWVNGTFMGP